MKKTLNVVEKKHKPVKVTGFEELYIELVKDNRYNAIFCEFNDVFERYEFCKDKEEFTPIDDMGNKIDVMQYEEYKSYYIYKYEDPIFINPEKGCSVYEINLFLRHWFSRPKCINKLLKGHYFKLYGLEYCPEEEVIEKTPWIFLRLTELERKNIEQLVKDIELNSYSDFPFFDKCLPLKYILNEEKKYAIVVPDTPKQKENLASYGRYQPDIDYFGSPEDFLKGDSIIIRESLDEAKVIIEKIGGILIKVISMEELLLNKYSLDYKFFKNLMESYLFADQWGEGHPNSEKHLLPRFKMYREYFFQDEIYDNEKSILEEDIEEVYLDDELKNILNDGDDSQ